MSEIVSENSQSRREYFKISDGHEVKICVGEKVKIGQNVILGSQCKEINVGYGSFIGDNVYIDTPILNIGEYTTIHKNTTIHGYREMIIGNNCWIGQNCILDCIAGTYIGNNVGIGTYSQIWSHMKFGDVLEGCRWNSKKPVVLEDDVWIVGHGIVSPITAHKKSMLLIGGVITKDMEENHIYGGTPAVDLTEKIGKQFKEVTLEEKKDTLKKYYHEYLDINNFSEDDFLISINESYDENMIVKEECTYFFVDERTYIPTRSDNEYSFMKYILYDKAKFNPVV